MSETIEKLFEGLRAAAAAANAVAPGLKNIKQDVMAEMSRLGTQGSMEVANVIWNGSCFVPYGPGAYTPPQEAQQEQHQDQQQVQEQSRGMGR